ncbi:MAG: hypothetical protein JNJ77_01005 [Planctomycetia bacterium]|nr:hypothetical protein [Planctomycetia bacterium]
MSQDFSQYDQKPPFDGGFPQTAAPVQQRGSSGCGKGCLIALVILLILAGVLVGVGIWVFNHVAKGITQNPEEIAQRLKQRFAGAVIPEGYRGLIGIKFALGFEMDLMIFGKENADIDEEGKVVSGDTMMLFSFSVPGMKQDDLEDALQSTNQNGKVIEKQPYTVKAGEYEFEGSKQKVQNRRGEERQTVNQIIVPLGNSTMVVMQSNEQVDEESLQAFLKSVAKESPSARKTGEKKEEKNKE